MNHLSLISVFKALCLFVVGLAPVLASAQPTASVMPTGKGFHIQSAQNFGRNQGGIWDLPGRMPEAIRDGANLQIWELDIDADRYYQFACLGNGYYTIHAGGDLAYAVTVEGGRSANGTNVSLRRANRSSSQQFLFHHLGNGRYKIYDRNGKIVNLKDTNARNGNNVQIWNDHNGVHNEWFVLDPQTKRAVVPTGRQEVAPPEPTKVRGYEIPLGRAFRIQSAVSHGRNSLGYWDLPGKADSVRTGANVQIWALDDGPDRAYVFEKEDDSRYMRIRVASSRNAVVTLGRGLPQNLGRLGNGQNIEIAPRNSSEGRQEFWLEHLGEGRFKIRHGSNWIVNLEGSTSDKNGKNVHVWSDHNCLHCEWFLIDNRTGETYFPGGAKPAMERKAPPPAEQAEEAPPAQAPRPRGGMQPQPSQTDQPATAPAETPQRRRR